MMKSYPTITSFISDGTYEPVNGGKPTTISYMQHPKLHISTDSLYAGFLLNTSGAMYSAVPMNVVVNLALLSKTLQIPKSANLIFPLESMRIFSGFKSL